MKNHHMAPSPACYLCLLPFPLFKGYRPCLQQIINPAARARLLASGEEADTGAANAGQRWSPNESEGKQTSPAAQMAREGERAGLRVEDGQVLLRAAGTSLSSPSESPDGPSRQPAPPCTALTSTKTAEPELWNEPSHSHWAESSSDRSDNLGSPCSPPLESFLLHVQTHYEDKLEGSTEPNKPVLLACVPAGSRVRWELWQLRLT
ncbi:uncharacterized protein LOC133627302 [Colius striatus]|uniref:uncharacterized protein LOC133627302 n=1 Tax=Colius striatus TaxID=57412 RepID=UPI002B1E2F87|nr:uncharacterized protein LOC133627302 [Colius striatus]